MLKKWWTKLKEWLKNNWKKLVLLGGAIVAGIKLWNTGKKLIGVETVRGKLLKVKDKKNPIYKEEAKKVIKDEKNALRDARRVTDDLLDKFR